jgi:hypothetical protein
VGEPHGSSGCTCNHAWHQSRTVVGADADPTPDIATATGPHDPECVLPLLHTQPCQRPTPDIATLLADAERLYQALLSVPYHRQRDAEGPHREYTCAVCIALAAHEAATPSGEAILDRLARAEAAVPDDPWLYDDGRGYGLTCYSCVQWKDLGHRENCKWLAARPAR